MTRVTFRAFAAIAIAATVMASGVALVAGRQTSVPSVFTIEQATAGRAAYAKSCASCHMPDLSGNIEIPPLAGAAFKSTWGARSTKDLFDYMSAAMPYGGPSLSAETYTSIIAFVLQSNGAVEGAEVLSATTAVPLASLMAPRAAPAALPAPPVRVESATGAALGAGAGGSSAPAP